jgi:hypothetical protein
MTSWRIVNLSLHDTLSQVEGALYGAKWQYGEDGYFTSNRFESLGGLGVFNAFSAVPSRGIEYQFVIHENPHALPATKLPQSLLEQFKETFYCHRERHRPAQGTSMSHIRSIPGCLRRRTWGATTTLTPTCTGQSRHGLSSTSALPCWQQLMAYCRS